MNSLKKEGSFDPRTAVAVLLIPLIWMGWNVYLNKKYPKTNPVPTVSNVSQKAEENNSILQEPSVVRPQLLDQKTQSDQNKPISEAEAPERLLSFSSDKVTFFVSSHGMAIKGYTLLKYSDRQGKNLEFGAGESEGLFSAYFEQKKINFNIEEIGPGVFRGSADIGNYQVVRELKFDSNKMAFLNQISVKNKTEEGHLKKIEVSLTIPEKVSVPKSSSFLFPSYEKQDFYLNSSGKTKSITFSTMKQDFSEKYTAASLIGVSSQYFTTALMDKSELIPELELGVFVEKHEALARVSYVSTNETRRFDLSQLLYIGPKGIDQLNQVDNDLPQIIDFGFFGFIAQPLLRLMKALHEVFGNWGLAIIFLTLLVRLCVMPFNIMSYRSMKAMQKIQPILQGLREKYKDDPVSLNKEMYALMKANKANPMGGCLPMLLQIPIFFALFRVIGSSIELYKSPFCGWITDLSSYDAYYVLPVLMGATMYLQQKLTPSTMDPAQAKVMAFLPIIFSFFMFQLPSGLTLYMFVSGLFGITQQYLFMRDKKA